MFKNTLLINAIEEGRHKYWLLKGNEQRCLVAHMVSKEEEILLKCDDERILQKAISDAILNEGSQKSLQHLYLTIKSIFVTGFSTKHYTYQPHFEDKINELLEEQSLDDEISVSDDDIESQLDIKTRAIEVNRENRSPWS